jgi:hypothetical protein
MEWQFGNRICPTRAGCNLKSNAMTLHEQRPSSQIRPQINTASVPFFDSFERSARPKSKWSGNLETESVQLELISVSRLSVAGCNLKSNTTILHEQRPSSQIRPQNNASVLEDLTSQLAMNDGVHTTQQSKLYERLFIRYRLSKRIGKRIGKTTQQ